LRIRPQLSPATARFRLRADNHQHYSNVTIDGKAPKANSPAAEQAMQFVSTGELGSDLVDLFKPPIVAEFKFRKATSLRDIPSLLYEFHIAAEKNTFWALRDSQGVTLHPEYEGALWLGRQSGQLLRLDLRPVRLPDDFRFTAADVTTDYTKMSIADVGVFLLPTKSEARACIHNPGASGSLCTANVLIFHDCRKFATKSRIITDNPQP
jgi:hypothetical protein